MDVDRVCSAYSNNKITFIVNSWNISGFSTQNTVDGTQPKSGKKRIREEDEDSNSSFGFEVTEDDDDTANMPTQKVSQSFKVLHIMVIQLYIQGCHWSGKFQGQEKVREIQGQEKVREF